VYVPEELNVCDRAYDGADVVMLLEADEALDVPLALVAVTVNVYAVEPVRPVIDIGDAPVPVPPAGDDVAVKVETAEPPVAPAVYATVAVVTPVAVALPIVGACGTVVAVIELEALESAESPTALVAFTTNV